MNKVQDMFADILPEELVAQMHRRLAAGGMLVEGSSHSNGQLLVAALLAGTGTGTGTGRSSGPPFISFVDIEARRLRRQQEIEEEV